MGTDFFDEDLAAPDAAARENPQKREDSATRPAEAEPGRMTRQKEDVSEEMAAKTDEIERLRMKQQDLEREKSDLESLSRRQDEYVRGKRDVIEKLERSVVLIEKEEVQATRMVEMLSATRSRFRETLGEIQQIDEERWPDEEFKNELNKALALIEEARQLHKKGVARIEAARWQEGEPGKAGFPRPERMDGESGAAGGFGFWLKAGLAFSLPLAALLIVVFLVYLVLARVV